MSCICCVCTIHILTIVFVMDMTQPQVSTLCSWSSNISAYLDRQPVWRGSILLLSTCGSYKPFWRGHSAWPGFLQLLWGTSLEDSWNHFWTEMQPQQFHISTAANAFECGCATGRFWVRLCRWCWPYLAEEQPCLWDQHLAAEIWTAPASRGRPLCGRDWEDPKKVPVRCCQTRVGNKARTVKGLVYVWYIHGIYMIYITYILLGVSATYLLCTFQLLSCATFPILPTSIASLCAKFKYYSKWYIPCLYKGIYIVYVRYIPRNHVALLSQRIVLCWEVLCSTFNCPQPWHGFTILKLQEIHKKRILIYLAYT
jgi:hypothetical protein